MSLLLGMHMIVAAWDVVTTKTVVNCLRKSKILSESQKTAVDEDNDPFKDLEEEIENLNLIELDLSECRILYRRSCRSSSYEAHTL